MGCFEDVRYLTTLGKNFLIGSMKDGMWEEMRRNAVFLFFDGR
jgi:hypothetical protein